MPGAISICHLDHLRGSEDESCDKDRNQSDRTVVPDCWLLGLTSLPLRFVGAEQVDEEVLEWNRADFYSPTAPFARFKSRDMPRRVRCGSTVAELAKEPQRDLWITFSKGFFECPADPRSTTCFSSSGSCRSKDRSTLISTLDDPLIRVHLGTLELGLFAALNPRRNRQRRGGKSRPETSTVKPQIRPALPFPHRTFCSDFAGPVLSLQQL